MRLAFLFVALAVVILAGVGICYSQGLFKSNSSHEVEVAHRDGEAALQSPSGIQSEPLSDQDKALMNLEGRKAFASERLKFQSLLHRLPRGRGIPPLKGLDDTSQAHWQSLDTRITEIQAFRVQQLKAYHEKTFEFFVRSPGQGPLRGPLHHDKERKLAFFGDEVDLLNLPEFETINQRGRPATFPESAGVLLNRISPDEELYSRYTDSLKGFLNPLGFGLVRDREHVSGFESHRMQDIREEYTFQRLNTDDYDLWLIEHVHLVGILQHERPVVYLTDKMPSMEQVRLGKTRPLDRFEEAALPSLVEGEDLFIARKDDTLRMLGAIRATKVCLQCHDANAGEMLGAFTYTLTLNPDRQEMP